MTTYPDVCLQNIVDFSPWWEEYNGPEYRPGRLVWAFLPYVDQVPLVLKHTGRGGEDGTEHYHLKSDLEYFNVKDSNTYISLPAAALPQKNKEVRFIYRAKCRPAIIISKSGKQVDSELKKGMASYQTAPMILVAPSFGVDSEMRSGYKPELVDRIRRCEYPQFLWDMLPINSRTQESLFRLDQIQPVGKTTRSIKFTDYCLSVEALQLIYVQIEWLCTGQVSADANFNKYRDFLMEI
ncbi:MAG: hypothetical protein SWH61_13000 [Thermodesulfobacteriota bacterium]|nr:hypothetical protein [Thermodesulfobacteriota bacterium]